MYLTLGDLFVLITSGLCLTRALRFAQILPIAVFCTFYFAPTATSPSVRHMTCAFAVYGATALRVPTMLQTTLPILACFGLLVFADIVPIAIHLADLGHLVLIRVANIKERRQDQVVSIGAGALLAAANTGLVIPPLTWAVAAMMLQVVTTYAHVYLTTQTMYHQEEALGEGASDAMICNSDVFLSVEFMHLIHSRLTMYHLMHGMYGSLSPVMTSLKDPLTNFAEATSRQMARQALRQVVKVLSSLSQRSLVSLLVQSNEAVKALIESRASKENKSAEYDPVLALDWALDQIFYRQMVLDPASVESVSRLAAFNNTPIRDLQLFVQSILNQEPGVHHHSMRSQVSVDFHQALELTASMKPLVKGMNQRLRTLLFGAKRQTTAIAILGRMKESLWPDLCAWIRNNKQVTKLLTHSLTWTDECTCVPLFPFLARLHGMPTRPSPEDRRQLSGMSQRELTLLFPMTLETSTPWTDEDELRVLNHLVLYLWCVLKASGMPARVHALYWSILRMLPARVADLAALARRPDMKHDPLAVMRFCLSTKAGIVAAGVTQENRDMALGMLSDAWNDLDTRIYCRVASGVATRVRRQQQKQLDTLIPIFVSVSVAVMGKFQLHTILPDWPPSVAQLGLQGPPLFNQSESREYRAMFTFSMSQFCDGLNRKSDHTLTFLILMLVAWNAAYKMGMTVFSATTHLIPMEIRQHVRAEAMANLSGNARDLLAGRSHNALDQLENAKAEQWFNVSLFTRNRWADVEWPDSNRRTSLILEDVAGGVEDMP